MANVLSSAIFTPISTDTPAEAASFPISSTKAFFSFAVMGPPSAPPVCANSSIQAFKTISNVCNLVNIVDAASVIILLAVGTTLSDPFAPFKRSPKVSKESANIVITLTGIPTPGGTDTGNGSALIIRTAPLTVDTRVCVVWAVASTVLKAPITFSSAP